MMQVIFWSFIILVALVEMFLVFSLGEHIYSVRFRRQYPSVSCTVRHGRALCDEICRHYPNARTAVDIGAGYGRLARAVANIPHMEIIAIENMWFSATVARFLNVLFHASRVRVIRADAFMYLAHSPKVFDIGVAYLGPGMNARLRDIASHFRVLITLDAPIPGMHPARTIDVPGGGYTYYHGLGRFPHRLYVYEPGAKGR